MMLPPKLSSISTVDGKQDCMYSGYSGAVVPQQYLPVADNGRTNERYSLARYSQTNWQTFKEHRQQVTNPVKCFTKFHNHSHLMFRADINKVDNTISGENTYLKLKRVEGSVSTEYRKLTNENASSNTHTEYVDSFYANQGQHILEDAEEVDSEVDEGSESEETEGNDRNSFGHMTTSLSIDHTDKVKDTGDCRKLKVKSTYKHIPHKDKPPHLVAKR